MTKLKPVPAVDIEVAKGSTEQIAIHVDDSAPDQAPFNGYLATYDISKGALLGLWHVAYGMVTGIKDFAVLLGHGVSSIPTGVINYLKLEAELWQEVKDDPVQRALFMNVLTHEVLLMYKEAPFLLNKVSDLYGAVNTAVSNHLNQVEQDVYTGDWEKGYTQLADDGTQVVGNVATLFVNPVKVAAPLAGAVLPRVAPLLEGLYAADRVEFVAETATLDEAAAAAAEGEQTAQGAVQVLRALRPGVQLTLTEMANYFGISENQYRELAKFCTENKLLVTLRSRAEEAIDLVERGIAYVKPAAIKLKTVNADDIKYLGYPAEVTTTSGEKVSSIGQVMILKPKYRSLRGFRAAMQAQGIALDGAQYARLEARWTQRTLEWLDPDPGYIHNLLKSADRDHSLALDWHWGENHIPPGLPGRPETVGFRMLKDSDSGALLPQVNAGAGWKSITGDVDLVSVTHADGSALTDEEYVALLKKLGAGSLGTQHPATATWYLDSNDATGLFDPSDPLFKDKAKYMMANECCVMQVGPDGYAAAVELRLDGSWFIDKNNYHLNYVGGYLMSTR